MKPKYKEMHEPRYREMLKRGLTGWGGEQVPEREKYWTDYWNEFVNTYNVPDKGKVLELGCGAGNISRIITAHGFDVTGIDISRSAIKFAAERNKHLQTVRFFEMNVTDLSRFADNSFDLVFDGLCFHCIIGKDRNLVFQEVVRVLKPGGFFLFNSICDEPKVKEIIQDFDPVSRCHISNGVPYRYFGKKEFLIEEITSSGFEIIREKIEVNPNGDSLRVIARLRSVT